MVDTAKILAAAHARAEASAQLLEELVRIESPTTHPASQVPVQELLVERFERLGMRVRLIPGVATGGHLLAVPRIRRRGAPYQMLVGHSDTVWPEGTLAAMPAEVREGRLSGPGSFDMKAGLVIGLTALEVLYELGDPPEVTPVFFINSDEETGSPESKKEVARLARWADRAWVLEPALTPRGLLKTARRGGGDLVLEVHGRSAHAGMDPERGASAIHELARLIGEITALADPARGVHINVGVISGGSRGNVIAPYAKAKIDVRILEAADASRLMAELEKLETETEGTRLSLSGEIDRPPMERTPRNRRLWRRAQEAAAALGFDLEEGTSGGGSDGNTTSLYTATLDGLGAVGDGAHAPHEYVELLSLPERAALLAVLLAGPPMTAD